jgi:hypothetical protein
VGRVKVETTEGGVYIENNARMSPFDLDPMVTRYTFFKRKSHEVDGVFGTDGPAHNCDCLGCKGWGNRYC